MLNTTQHMMHPLEDRRRVQWNDSIHNSWLQDHNRWLGLTVQTYIFSRERDGVCAKFEEFPSRRCWDIAFTRMGQTHNPKTNSEMCWWWWIDRRFPGYLGTGIRHQLQHYMKQEMTASKSLVWDIWMRYKKSNREGGELQQRPSCFTSTRETQLLCERQSMRFNKNLKNLKTWLQVVEMTLIFIIKWVTRKL